VQQATEAFPRDGNYLEEEIETQKQAQGTEGEPSIPAEAKWACVVVCANLVRIKQQ